MAAGIEELRLPSIAVPGLFMTEKIITISTASGPPPGLGFETTNQPAAGPAYNSTSIPAMPTGIGLGSTAPIGAILVNTPSASTRPASLLPSYSSALQTTQVIQDRTSTPDLEPSGGSLSSNTSDASSPQLHPSSTLTRARHINPSIVELIAYITSLNFSLPMLWFPLSSHFRSVRSSFEASKNGMCLLTRRSSRRCSRQTSSLHFVLLSKL